MKSDNFLGIAIFCCTIGLAFNPIIQFDYANAWVNWTFNIWNMSSLVILIISAIIIFCGCEGK